MDNKKFIYCLEDDKDRLLKEGFTFICNQKLGDKNYCVFENKEILNPQFSINDFITTNKMFYTRWMSFFARGISIRSG